MNTNLSSLFTKAIKLCTSRTPKLHIVANKKFLSANPVARKWFELVQIPVADMNVESLRIKEGEDKPEDILRHAKEWVENNQEKYDSWLEIARQASN